MGKAIKAAIPTMMLVAIILLVGTAPDVNANEVECFYLDAESVDHETVSALFQEGWFSLQGDAAERLYSSGCAEDAFVISELPDGARWDLASKFGLPEAPSGYFWIYDDLTLGEYPPAA